MIIIFTPTLLSAGEILAGDEAGPWKQLWQHSRQVGRAPLEFGSFPEAVEGGEDHAGKQLLNHLPGTSQATSVLSLGSFLHDLCRMPSAMPPPPDATSPFPVSPSPPLLQKRLHLYLVSENSSGYSPAQSFHFQLGELLTCSRFCSNPRTCNSQGHRTSAEEADSRSSPAAAPLTPSCSGAQSDSLSIE